MTVVFCQCKSHNVRFPKHPRALSNLKNWVGKLSCTTLRVVIPTTRSVVQLIETWGHDTFMCGLDFLPLDLR